MSSQFHRHAAVMLFCILGFSDCCKTYEKFVNADLWFKTFHSIAEIVRMDGNVCEYNIFFWKIPYMLNMKINYSYCIEKKWLWWRAIVKHQQILKLCNLLPNYCNIVDIVGRQCIVTMGVIGWTKGTLLSIGTKMVNMNFE